MQGIFSGASPRCYWPVLIEVPAQVYALVGVAAMLAGNCRVPLTSVLLLFELTRDYFIILVSRTLRSQSCDQYLLVSP